MKRTLIISALCLLLVGCGNKSNGEIVDIEQFKCQDSIEKVLNVLGNTNAKISTYGNNTFYNYDNLNLWGYDGTAVFEVRDDKETISEFYCKLRLNNKEFEELLSYFSEKHGSYEVSSFGDTKSYKWTIGEDDDKIGYDEEEVGYDEVVIRDNGDKQYKVSFSDEWSIIKDEVYYEKVEEKKQEEEGETEINILAEKTHTIEQDTFRFTFGEMGDKYKLSLHCNIDDKSDAFSTHIVLNGMMNSEDENLKAFIDTMNFSYLINIGDGSTIIRSKDALLMMSKENKIISVADYFSAEWMISDEYHESDYGRQVSSFLIDFIESN